jgi:malonyl CoA-acyl carrier protein transacylase/phosphopantetheinyl transferase (holo-ACP synthase)
MLSLREELTIAGAEESPVSPRKDESPAWDTEVFVVGGANRADVLRRTQSLQAFLRHHSDVDLKDLAYTLNTEPSQHEARLAILAGSSADVQARLIKAAERLSDSSRTQIKDAAGIYYFDKPLYAEGGLALLFPGEGAQYLGMLADLVPHFPEIEKSLQDAERFAQSVSPAAVEAFRHVFRLPAGATKQQRAEAEKTLRQLHTAIFSVMLADGAMFQLLSQLGLKPVAVAGHSMGEVSALQAIGCIAQGEGVLTEVGALLDVWLSQEAVGEVSAAILLAVGAGKTAVEQVIRDTVGAGAFLAMDNCPHQSVVVGPPDIMTIIETELQTRRFMCERLPFDRPYHTPLFEPYLGPVRELYDRIEFHAARIPLYSCSTGVPFPNIPSEIRQQTVLNYAAPVEFTQLIKNMHADGVRLFVECGPRGNLTSFAEDILRGEKFAAVASNVPHRSGIAQLNHLAAQLAAHHVPVNFDHFYCRRNPRRLQWDGAAPASPIGAESHAKVTRRHNRITPKARDGQGEEEAPTITEAAPDWDLPIAAASLREVNSSSSFVAPTRSDVVTQYFAVMQQFLDDQSDVMNAYFERTRPVDGPELDIAGPDDEQPSLLNLPMLRTATIVRFEAGREIVVRRKLDLTEDLFVSHHAVGGQAVSKADPNQHGLPVMPMTFSLTIMGEVASALVPDHVVVRLERVRLFRWLAFDEEVPTSIEVSARMVTETTSESEDDFRVQVEIRELSGSDKGSALRSAAAEGVVILAERYAEPPPVGEFPLTNEHPSRIPLDVLYRNLFHGPLFQGTQPGGRAGDEGIERDLVVLPRHQLLRSNPDPGFLMDPVLLDVALHPISAWHLEFPDQSGRILLPVDLDRIDLFGSRPDVGARFICRVSILASSYRHFVHAVDLIDENGKFWSRIHRVTLWRFYVPFANVNFFGPKDEYFISKEWGLAEPRSAIPTSCMRLDIPPDQKQAAMRLVTAKVILAPSEFAQFRAINGDEQRESQWLFDRLAAKDAVRVLWHDRHNERLFPADIIVDMQENGNASARPRGPAGPEPFPTLSTARTDDIVVAFAAFRPHAGIALEHLKGGRPGLTDSIFRTSERALLDQFGADRDEWMARLWCAKQAMGKALNCATPGGLQAMEICGAEPQSGRVKIKLHAPLSESLPEGRSGALVAHTARDGDLVVATSVCEHTSL